MAAKGSEIQSKIQVQANIQSDIRHDSNSMAGRHLPQESKESKEQDEVSKTLLHDSRTFVILDIPSGSPLEPNCLEQNSGPKQIVSQEFRKKLSDLEVYNQIKSVLKFQFQKEISGSREASIEALKYYMEIYQKNLEPRFLDACHNFLSEFERSEENNIIEFLERYISSMQIKICEDFLKKINVNFLQTYQRINDTNCDKVHAENPIIKPTPILEPWESLPIHEKAVFLRIIANLHFAEIHGQEVSPWTPSDKIDVIFDLIKDNQAPISMYADLGANLYNKFPNSAFEPELDASYNTYEFLEEGHTGKTQGLGNTISVIGVKENQNPAIKSQGWIYYVDPHDLSIPGNKRYVYRVSYEKFCEWAKDNYTCGIYNKKLSDLDKGNLPFGFQKRKQNIQNLNTFTVSDPQFILLNVPSGKPNRRLNPDDPHSPPRVVQKRQKGKSCLYYATKVGAILDKDYLVQQSDPARKAVSQKYRKKITEDFSFDLVESWLQPLAKELLVQSKLDIIENLKRTLAQQQMFFDADFVGKIQDIINKFEQSPENNFLQFFRDNQARFKIEYYLDFLKAIHVDPIKAANTLTHDVNQRIKGLNPHFPVITFLPSKELPLSEQANNLDKICTFQLQEIYGQKLIDWRPTDKIEKLFDLIKKNESPILITGAFGHQMYNKPPLMVDRLDNYKVFGFVKGSHKGKAVPQMHAISVVGVKKNDNPRKPGQGWIYYIDPNDGSEPNMRRKIYVMTYEQFCDLCHDKYSPGYIPNDPRRAVYDFASQKPKAK